jgi:hypothetical protein
VSVVLGMVVLVVLVPLHSEVLLEEVHMILLQTP